MYVAVCIQNCLNVLLSCDIGKSDHCIYITICLSFWIVRDLVQAPKSISSSDVHGDHALNTMGVTHYRKGVKSGAAAFALSVIYRKG